MAIGDQANVFTRIRNGLPHWFGDVTPILDALIQGLANSGAFVYSLYAYAKLQTRIKTATDGWLDMIAADFFGSTIQRSANQTDASFRATILINMLRERTTRNAIIKVLQDVTGRTPIIIEPQRPADVGSYGAAVAVSRATIATYIDSNGIVRTAAANQVRYQNNALLIEGTSKNLLNNSTYTALRWTDPSASGITFAPGQTAPDGSNTAVRCDFTTATGINKILRILFGTTPSTSTQFAGSFFARLVSGSTGTLSSDIGDAGPGLSFASQLVAGQWVRIINVPAIYGTATAPSFIDVISNTAASFVIDLWGADVEPDTLVSSSYIPTNGAPVTRAADVLLNNMTAGSAALGGYGAAGAYGSLLLPYQAFVQAFRPSGSGIPFVAGYGASTGGYGAASRADYASILQVTGAVTDADIYNAIDSVKPAGTTLWTKINA